MPIKEIITLGLISVAVIAAKGGPMDLRENLLKAQIQILHDVGKTSSWGAPLIWHSRSSTIRNRVRTTPGKIRPLHPQRRI